MGGKYDEEEGLLEPDVGGEYAEEHMEHKEWCTFQHAPGVEQLIVFNAPNTFSIRIISKTDPSVAGHFLEIWDNDVKKEFTPSTEGKAAAMCFEAELGVRVPKGTYCIKGTQKHVWMTIEPGSLEHRLRF